MLVEKFTESYIQMINKYFPRDENDFIIYGGPVHKGIELHCLREKNVWTVMNGYLFSEYKYRNFLLKHKKIIIHGLFEAGIIYNWAHDEELLSHTYIYLYGEYCSIHRINEPDYHKIIQNAAGIVNIYKTENELVKKLYSPYGVLFSAFYIETRFSDLYKNRIDKSKAIKIQIGNSASETLQHIKIIDMLAKFKNEDIKIYAPLSYGDMQYAERVESYGKKIFGDKFVTLRNFIPKKEFIDFITSIDIAIFGMQRQQAGDNIDMNLRVGNCVYLPRDSVMAEIYEKEIGCKIKYINDIEYMDFKEFRSWKEQDGNNNSFKIVDYYSDENFVSKWKRVFNYPMKK